MTNVSFQDGTSFYILHTQKCQQLSAHLLKDTNPHSQKQKWSVSTTFQDPTSSTLKLMIKCQHRDIGTPHFHGNLGIIGKDLGKPKSSEQ